MEEDTPIQTVNRITFYTRIVVFVIVSCTELYVVSKRRFKLDPSALITLSLYFTVTLIRFVSCFINNKGGGLDIKDDSPFQTAISLSCHTLISMSIYFFVFEMQAVRIQLEQLANFETLKQSNLKIRNFVMGITLIYGISYSTIRTVFSVDRQFVSTTEEVAYVITFTTKLILDIYVIILFSTVLSFFYQRRKQALSREALRMTPLNQLVLVTIFFLYFMRIAGSLYTFIVGILVLIPSVFNSTS
jgi:hypothetical protein